MFHHVTTRVSHPLLRVKGYKCSQGFLCHAVLSHMHFLNLWPKVDVSLITTVSQTDAVIYYRPDHASVMASPGQYKLGEAWLITLSGVTRSSGISVFRGVPLHTQHTHTHIYVCVPPAPVGRGLGAPPWLRVCLLSDPHPNNSWMSPPWACLPCEPPFFKLHSSLRGFFSSMSLWSACLPVLMCAIRSSVIYNTQEHIIHITLCIVIIPRHCHGP